MRVRDVVVAAAVIGLSCWQAQLWRDSAGAHWGVAVLLLVAVVAAVGLGRRRQRQTAGDWLRGSVRIVRAWRTQPTSTIFSLLMWGIVVGGIVGWDLASFIAQSHALPTLSYFIGHVTRYRVGRGVVFALWLGSGACLVAGYRAKAPQR
jgi:hypothetical protein